MRRIATKKNIHTHTRSEEERKREGTNYFEREEPDLTERGRENSQSI